ncbi:MAG: acetyl-CoA carboxylase biotin carboxyl carrier protein subunit [Candidatus Lambdaproteobacteria bacterium]|nr:acetyl-CoA carboxylase biotin carboxyl carrier protein subunit [Candidatus Lambdaproteobacteria bacterium]
MKAELTGKVWKIEKQPGDRVESEEDVIILESMKMEIPLTAPQKGRVKEILVKEGDSVTEGQEIAVLEV